MILQTDGLNKYVLEGRGDDEPEPDEAARPLNAAEISALAARLKDKFLKLREERAMQELSDDGTNPGRDFIYW